MVSNFTKIILFNDFYTLPEVNPNKISEKIAQQIAYSAKDSGREIYKENRFLTKAFGNNKCPFLTHILQSNTYMAFGPNDELSKIHQPNESLSKETILLSFNQFEQALNATAQ